MTLLRFRKLLGGDTRPAQVPTTRERHPVVVIGSGFGGGVASLRLAEAGVPVLVLERGRHWPTGPNADTFPRPGRPDRRALWHSSAPLLFGRYTSPAAFTGLVEAVKGENMTVMCAAGVGGGSLLYQGMTLQPAENVFNETLPVELDYERMDSTYYPRVAQMLKLATAPDSLIDSPNYAAARVFARRVAEAGYQLEKIPMPIDWSFAQRELDGEMKASYTNGDCAFGVNNGGKHSIDVTYLAAARATGRVTLAALHEVTRVARERDGSWRIEVDRLDDKGRTVEHKVITTDSLIMAAGSINTTKLLVRAAAEGSIPDLPDDVGRGWGTNGDRIYVWTELSGEFGPVQGGPVVYGSKDWADPRTANTVIQASLPPLAVDIRSTVLVGFGVSPARGQWRFDAERDEVRLRWPADGDHELHAHISGRVHAIAQDGRLLDTNRLTPSTWHPLGGANMGPVCDLAGRVHGQRGLYVLDGALIPGSTAACNPSMTIAAVAERAMDELVRDDFAAVG